MSKGLLRITVIVAAVCLGHKPALGEPWLPPGDILIRSDLQLLADVGMLQVPISTWPLSLANIAVALEDADSTEANPMAVQALQRVRIRLRDESRVNNVRIRSSIRGSSEPRVSRTFEDTPRAGSEMGGSISWMGRRFAFKAQARKASDVSANDSSGLLGNLKQQVLSLNLDGSYVGASVGNWMLAAGYPERWWGPGWDGSLILSTNARPGPQLSIKRNITRPFNSRWLSWIGPWSLTSFFQQLDDERVIQDASLFGLRMTAVPIDGLEIGLSRTAQWCGTGRPCDTSTFVDLLLGRDNEGVNIEVGRQPGNQLAGIDLRWASPIGDSSYATYLQWIGEDSRQGGPQIGSWLRQLGVEFWGIVPGLNWQHRSHVEWADTTCRDGGIGLGNKSFDCAYNHHLYKTGYRYEGRSIGHGIDSDSFSSSIGSTLIDSRGNSVNFLVRHMQINRDAQESPLSSVQQKILELSVSYNRRFSLGTGSIGLAYSNLREDVVGNSTNSTVEWWAGFQTN